MVETVLVPRLFRSKAPSRQLPYGRRFAARTDPLVALWTALHGKDRPHRYLWDGTSWQGPTH